MFSVGSQTSTFYIVGLLAYCYPIGSVSDRIRIGIQPEMLDPKLMNPDPKHCLQAVYRSLLRESIIFFYNHRHLQIANLALGRQ